MDIERDVGLDYVLQQLSIHPDRVGTIPLVGIDLDIRMQATETPGEYLVAVWSRDADPHQMADAVTVTPLQFAALAGPLIRKNQKMLERQGQLIALEAEKFLRELTA